jgi:thiosulfate dehydrogenase [quinone] large subunit
MNDAQMPHAAPDQHHAYVLLRVLTGFDFFGHGFARTFTGTHLSGFAQGMVKSMATAPLPSSLTLASGYAIPVVELVIGILLLLGLVTRYALILAFLLMLILMFGVTMKQDWASAGTQLMYGLVLAMLLFAQDRYDLSWPALLRRASF